MPYRICKTIEIENGHMLTHHPDKCRFPHGHSRKVEIILETDNLDENGMVCDFKVVKDAVGDYLETFDHALCVNTQDPMFDTLKKTYGDRVIAFEETEPTTEVLAKTFFDAFRTKLNAYACDSTRRYNLMQDVRLVRVRVWETSSSWAEYEHPRVYDVATAVDRIEDVYKKYLAHHFPLGFTSWSSSHGGPFGVQGEVKEADIFIEVCQRHSPRNEVLHPNEPASVPGGKFYTLINFGYEDRDWQVIRNIVSSIEDSDIFIKLPDSLKQLTLAEALAKIPTV
jgi:6-pyruvoyltetrahydropterin/6-carboxytetrahydropterin synthase